MFKDLHELVTKLSGKIEPLGESHEDDFRFENLENTIELTEKLIQDIIMVARWKDHHAHSIDKAGTRADEFINHLKEMVGEKYKSGDLKEKDLDVYDLWQSPNSNLFLKINENESLVLGPYKEHHSDTNGRLTYFSTVQSNSITEVKHVGFLKINTDLLE